MVKTYNFFQKIKADIDFDSLNYDYVKLRETKESSDCGERTLLTIHNPHQLKIHPEKQIAEVLGLSRSQVKKLVEQGDIKLEKNSLQFISAALQAERVRCP